MAIIATRHYSIIRCAAAAPWLLQTYFDLGYQLRHYVVKLRGATGANYNLQTPLFDVVEAGNNIWKVK